MKLGGEREYAENIQTMEDLNGSPVSQREGEGRGCPSLKQLEVT